MPQPDLIITPFAQDAPPSSVDPIPETRSPSDPLEKATWRDGFPGLTMIPLAAGGIPPRGQDFNGVLKAISEHTVFLEGGGQYKWSSEIADNGGYEKDSILISDDGLALYVSAVNGNTTNFNTTPGSIGTSWLLFAGVSALDSKAEKSTQVIAGTGLSGGGDLSANRSLSVNFGTTAGTAAQGNDPRLATAAPINAPIATVAAAGTIDLTTGAPNTSQLAISGTGVSISGFTVAAGRCYFVRFAGALTLTNSASLVTQTGTDITTAAGDTCIIRAISANAVEILCGDFLSHAATGTRGQTWQNVAGIRAAGTTYTNTTGRPIMVTIDTGGAEVYVDGLQITAPGGAYGVQFIVPAGSTYSAGAGAIDRWLELR